MCIFQNYLAYAFMLFIGRPENPAYHKINRKFPDAIRPNTTRPMSKLYLYL